MPRGTTTTTTNTGTKTENTPTVSESIDFLRALQEEIHENNVAHGWTTLGRTFGDHLALIHSELSEALGEFRNGYRTDEVHYRTADGRVTDSPRTEDGTLNKPEGVPAELADVVIRVFGTAGELGIDLADAILCKLEFNTTRDRFHGGKTI